jgi:hypothetical protein
MNELNLQEVDKLEVTVLVDNYSDVLLLHQFAEGMPKQFILNSVGTTYVFQ